jgi:hypothetical protein
MTNNAPEHSPARARRVHSINFEAADDDWMESVVDILKRAGLPKAGRSEIVRVALFDLRRALAWQDRADTVVFFVERDLEWRRARLEPPDSQTST